MVRRNSKPDDTNPPPHLKILSPRRVGWGGGQQRLLNRISVGKRVGRRSGMNISSNNSSSSSSSSSTGGGDGGG